MWSFKKFPRFSCTFLVAKHSNQKNFIGEFNPEKSKLIICLLRTLSKPRLNPLTIKIKNKKIIPKPPQPQNTFHKNQDSKLMGEPQNLNQIVEPDFFFLDLQIFISHKLKTQERRI